jgi:hypothetical protein
MILGRCRAGFTTRNLTQLDAKGAFFCLREALVEHNALCIDVPLGLSGVYTVRDAWEFTAATEYIWEDFEITLTPEDTPFTVLRRAPVTLHAMGADCEFSTFEIDPTNCIVHLTMTRVDYFEEEETTDE